MFLFANIYMFRFIHHHQEWQTMPMTTMEGKDEQWAQMSFGPLGGMFYLQFFFFLFLLTYICTIGLSQITNNAITTEGKNDRQWAQTTCHLHPGMFFLFFFFVFTNLYMYKFKFWYHILVSSFCHYFTFNHLSWHSRYYIGNHYS